MLQGSEPDGAGDPQSRAREASPLSPGRVVWILGLTQTVGYGTLYYSFGVLSPRIAADLGWPVTWVFGAFSLALLAGGAAAPFAGQLVDRLGAPRVMAAGSALAGLSLAFAAAGGPWPFLAGLVLAQAFSTLALYDAAFACLAQILGRDARARITQLTLIAGFASSLFWPLTTWLGEAIGWRGTHLVYGLINLLVLAPANLTLLVALPAWPRPRPIRTSTGADAGPSVTTPPDTGLIPRERRREAMILLAASFAIGGFALSAILAQMVPLFTALGLGGSAVLVSTLFGPAQVLIRFGTVVSGTRTGPLATAAFALSMIPLATALLALTGSSVAGAAVVAIALGFGSGLKSIVQGTVPLMLFGAHGYGATLGRLGAARLIMGALAPFVLSLLIETTGPRAALALLTVTGVVGLALLAAVARMARSGTS